MLAPLNTLPSVQRAAPTQPLTRPEQAPDGYQGGAAGVAAGQRVQPGAEAEGQPLGQRAQGERLTLEGTFVVNGAPGVVTGDTTVAPLPSDGVLPGQPKDPAAEAGQGADAATSEISAEASEQDEVAGGTALAAEEQAEVEDLQKRDAEVRSHEQAHAGAGGADAGSPRLSFETGPDGRSYAVDGEVSIDTAPVSGDPEATITKMQRVRRAALAPSSPSSQDQRVAASASQAEAAARAELTSASSDAPEDQTVVGTRNQAPAGLPEPSSDGGAKHGEAEGQGQSALPGSYAADAVARHHGQATAQRTYARLEHGDAVDTLYGDNGNPQVGRFTA